MVVLVVVNVAVVIVTVAILFCGWFSCCKCNSLLVVVVVNVSLLVVVVVNVSIY